MKKVLKFFICLMLIIITGCSKEETIDDTQNNEQTSDIASNRSQTDELFEYVINLYPYGSLDEEYAFSYINEIDAYSQGLGSSFIKKIDDFGDIYTLAAKNYDHYISNYPVYVYETSILGFYRTIGITYTPFLGQTRKEIMKSRIDDDFVKVIPFLASDVLNSNGFYIGVNNIINETDEENNILFTSTGTNEDAEISVPTVALARYLGERCGSVSEALELINNINVYSINQNGVNFNYSFTLADANGEFGVLEIANNRIYWNDQETVYTNYYLNPNLSSIQRFRNGIGRYDYILNNLDNITNTNDVEDLLSDVSISHMYDHANAKYDVRADYVGLNGDGNDYLLDDSRHEDLKVYFTKVNETYSTFTYDELRDNNNYLGTIYNIIVDCENKTMDINFFDSDNQTSIDLKVN